MADNERDAIEFDFDMEVVCVLTEQPGIGYQEAARLVAKERREEGR